MKGRIENKDGWAHYVPVLDAKPIDLYTPEGWPNIKGILDKGYPFNIIVSGRGVGKSCTSIIEFSGDEWKDRVMYMRRRESITKMMTDMNTSQFAKVSVIKPELELDVEPTTFGGLWKCRGEKHGYITPLSTFSKARGVNYDKVDVVIFDEICPERGERILPEEGYLFDNAYETINRNREFAPIGSAEKPSPPLQTLLLGNAEKLTAPILTYWNMSREFYEMQTKKISQRYFPDKGIAIFYLFDSPISEQKKETALYRRNKGTAMYNMAVNNLFTYDTTYVARRDLSHYKHIAGVGTLNIYKSRNSSEWYITERKTDTVLWNRELEAFRHRYTELYYHYLDGKIYFADVMCLAVFQDYMKIRE